MPRQLEPKVFVGTEDCLYLNVYAPANRSIDHLLPVIVYIYAGAFQFSSLQGFEQNNFMDKDVIFVTFNYRHGILGFLSTEDEAVSGNMGLKDQVLALKWVKEHIRAFGGDDNSVTLIGNSAGGACVHYHYLSPLSVGLFHRGISLSSSALMPWAQAKNSRENALALGKLMNCSSLDVHELVDCLRNVPARALVEVQPKFMVAKEIFYKLYTSISKEGHKNHLLDSIYRVGEELCLLLLDQSSKKIRITLFWNTLQWTC